jgi:hypothetical protein
MTTIKLWEVASGREVRTLTGHNHLIQSLAFSPDGFWLASASMDGTVKLWEVVTGRELRSLALKYPWSAESVAFSPDGRWLASGGGDNTIKLWEVATGQEVRALAGRAGTVNSVAFSPDGRWLASGAAGSKDQTAQMVKLWDVATGRELRTFPGHTESVESVAFSPDGRWLASGSLDHTVKLWEVATGRETHTLAGHTNWVRSVAFSPDGRYVATGSDDGSTRIWERATGEEVAAQFSLPEQLGWLVVTPDGLFDGSPSAWEQIAWRFAENRTGPLEMFFNEFYYPGLLADILAGKRPKAPRDIAQVDRRQPEVKLSVVSGQPSAISPQPSAQASISEPTVSLRIEVAEAAADAQHPTGSGVRDVRLFRNGSLVKVWRGDVLAGKGDKVTLEATVPIVAGENRFTAYAFNRDNVKSLDASLMLTGAESLKRSGVAWVLAVGVNRYTNPDYALSYAVADVRAFADELQRQQTQIGAFGSVEVVSLVDDQATKANILRALAILAGKEQPPPQAAGQAPFARLRAAQPEDAVFMYFAGHGTARGPRFYLVPHDLGYEGLREELDKQGLETILAHSISDEELEHAFETVDAGRMLLVIDACNSGQALEAEEKRRGPMNSKGLAQLAYEKGMYVLTAAQGYQAALEAAQLGHGYLTYALVEEGLKTPSADSSPKDGNVMVREWLDYATLRVPLMQEQGMQDARKLGRNLAVVEGEEEIDDLAKRSLQRPRVFYRREPESVPFVVAKPPAKPEQ